MNEQEMVAPFRIAFRVEGQMVNAYLAPPDTMEGATYLGGVVKKILDVDHPASFEKFKQIMQAGMRVFVKETMNVDVHHFDEQDAPTHEKAGHG